LMGAEIKHAFARAEKDDKVVVIILTGAGRGFCAGADLGNLEAMGKRENANQSANMSGWGAPDHLADAQPGDPTFGDDFQGTYTYPMSIPKPVIAAINGPVAGMAMPIALACDIRFASNRAVFTTAFSRRGLIAEWGLSWLLGRLVGPGHTLDLLFSARKVDAQEAERLGLVNRVIEHDHLIDHVREYAKDLAANCSPTSMSIMKRQVYQQLSSALGPAEKEARALMAESLKRDDFREGVASFLEKRTANFVRL